MLHPAPYGQNCHEIINEEDDAGAADPSQAQRASKKSKSDAH